MKWKRNTRVCTIRLFLTKIQKQAKQMCGVRSQENGDLQGRQHLKGGGVLRNGYVSPLICYTVVFTL
jgi:hypothetical protein